jgi:sigma-B regulation protein RsbU (phosphoserine phosphatase)
VLGPLREAEYERGFLRIEPGDLVVLYTDGITETLSDADAGERSEEYGVDRLVELCRARRGLPAEELVGAILDEVKEFSGDRPVADDRTVVVVKRPE